MQEERRKDKARRNKQEERSTYDRINRETK